MAYRRGNRDRIETPPATRLQVLARDNWTCQECGVGVGRASLEVHHRQRLADGGANDLDNLQTLCRCCHIRHHQDELAAASPTYRARREWNEYMREIQHG